jgi:hypothetical protein
MRCVPNHSCVPLDLASHDLLKLVPNLFERESVGSGPCAHQKVDGCAAGEHRKKFGAANLPNAPFKAIPLDDLVTVLGNDHAEAGVAAGSVRAKDVKVTCPLTGAPPEYSEDFRTPPDANVSG